MSDELLTPKEERFCVEYLIDLNGTQAAKRAGYKGSVKVLGVTATRLLAKASAKARIDELKMQRNKRVLVNADEILRELARIGYSDPRQVFGEDGKIKDPKDWPEDLARAIASIEVDEIFEFVDGKKIWTGYTKKVKFWNKVQSLELLGKHRRLFTDRIEIENSSLAERIIKARTRRRVGK